MKRGCAIATVWLFAMASVDADPVIDVDPNSIDFGKVFEGNSLIRTLEIANSGDANLEVTNIAMSGGNLPPRNDFDIPLLSGDFPPAYPVVIAPGDSVMFNVIYSPSNVGVDSDEIEISTNDPVNLLVEVDLTGEGVASLFADIDVSPSSLRYDYGARFIGTTSSRAVSMTNEGTGVLSVSSVTLTGSGRSQYSLSGVPGAVTLLDPGETLTVTATFRPGRIGQHSASVAIVSNDEDEGSVSVNLSGTALLADRPEIVVDPASVDFGAVFVGAASTQALTITNNGTQSLIVSNIEFVEGSSPDFSITGELTLPIELAAGASAGIDLAFNPSAEGPATGALSIESNDDDESVTEVSLDGTGAPTPDPEITVDTDPSLDFGLVQAGTSATDMATIRNTGVAVLDVTNISLADGSSPDFTYDGPESVSLVPGAEFPLSVTYAPTGEGFDGGVLVVTSEDPDEPSVEISLSGNGVQDAVANIDVDTDPSLAYGRVLAGTALLKVVTIANTGSANLEVTGISLGIGTSAEYTITNGPVLPVSIAPGARVEVEVTYAPVDAGFDSGTVVIESADAIDALITVSLTGIGISDGAPQIEVEPEILDFGSHVFADPATLGVTVRNIGSVDLQVTSVSVDVDGSQTFTVGEPTQFTLVPGSETVVEVTFTPTVIAEPKTNVLLIESNDVANPVVSVSLVAEVAPFVRLRVTPGALNFGEVEIGSSTTLDITLRNSGREPLDVTSMVLGEGSSDTFTLLAPDPVVLERGEEVTLEVSYSPTEEVTDTGAVEVSSNDALEPVRSVSLTGTGVPQAVMQLRVAPRTLEFGGTLVGKPVTKDLTIMNVGTDRLDLSEVVVRNDSSPTFELTVGPESMTVEPGGETTVKVTYTPFIQKADSGIIRIASNDHRRPDLSVSLFGFGTGDAGEPTFNRGDSNSDGLIDISDVAKTLTYLFAGGSEPGCLDAADFNDDGEVDISDGLFTLTRLFGGGDLSPLTEGCETDQTSDALSLCSYNACEH